jgi:hypothetical protein
MPKKRPNNFIPSPLDTEGYLDEITLRMQELHERWTPHEQQKKILESIFQDNKKRVFIRCGRKWGKTELCLYILWRIAIMFPNSACCYVGPTLKQQRKIVWKNRRLHNFPPPSWKMDVSKMESTIYLPNGSFIEIDGSDNDQGDRGTEYDVIVMEEFKDMDFKYYEAVYPNLVPRNGLLVVIGTPPERWITKGATGEIEYHHYYKIEQEAREDPDWVTFHAPTWSNPHISKTWCDKEREKYKKRGELDTWQREYEALYVAGQNRSIFPMFSQATHAKHLSTLIPLIKVNIKKWEFYCSIDPGTTSVLAALFIAYNRSSGQIIVLDEVYLKDKSQTSAGVSWNVIQSKRDGLDRQLMARVEWKYIYDEAAAWYQNEIWTHFGIPLTPSKKHRLYADGENGLSLMKDMFLTENCYFVAVGCRNHIFELENYNVDLNGNLPKTNDHCLSGDTIIHTTKGDIPIKNLVNKTGYLYSRNGKVRKFYNVKKTGAGEVYRVLFTDGRWIDCTNSHPILDINNNWRTVLDLEVDDLIQCVMYEYNNHKSNNSRVLREKILSLWSLFSKGWQSIAQGCLGLSLWPNSQRFAYSSQGRGQEQQLYQQSCYDYSQRAYASPYNSREQREEEAQLRTKCQTESVSLAQKQRGERVAFQNEYIRMEEERASGSFLSRMWQKVFYSISDKIIILPSKLQSYGLSTQIKSITKLEREEVYNLEVEDTHCFSVNGGIIVHNSIDAFKYFQDIAGFNLNVYTDGQRAKGDDPREEQFLRELEEEQKYGELEFFDDFELDMY